METQFTLENIKEIAIKFWKEIEEKPIIAFHGEMGAGKTTFIHALCDVRGVKDIVGSPTFSIINEYLYDAAGVNGKIYHIDLYRLKDEEEALRAGVEECFYSDHTCFVEWPDRATEILPLNTLHVYIKMVDEKTRQISY